MPSDAVGFVVSTGIGVSVVAGLLSGVLYVIKQGIQSKRRRSRKFDQWHCAICGSYLRSIEGILEGDRVVTCSRCNRRVCKGRCCVRDKEQGGWICINCETPWYQEILKIFPYKDLIKLRTTMDPIQNNTDNDIELIRKKEKEQIREFIEKLVESLIGETIDDASVTKLYNDKNYDALFERYHQELSNALTDLGSALHISIANLPLIGQQSSPCTAHTVLKQIIQKLIKDALTLPVLQECNNNEAQGDEDVGDGRPCSESSNNNRTYEDLLATAILNKVINSCQNNLPTSSAASISSRRSTTSSSFRNRNDKEYFFGEETLDIKYKNADVETTSVSSLEEWINNTSSDHSLGSTKYVDRVSLTIQQRIEEVSPTTDSEDEEDSAYFRTGSSLLADDDTNWYLQKRQFHGTHSPVPVPMLVPNPTVEAKVLIGDKEIDETSDLSDVASDYGDNNNDDDDENSSNVPGLLLESKMIIGGKNLIDSMHLSDAESSADSGVREDREDDEKYFIKEKTNKTDITLDDENVEDTSIISIYSNTEKDTEYTEKYASLPRTITKTVEIKALKEENENKQEKEPEFQGYYSKKEKEKWNHPVELKNNPYSRENIEKRMKNAKNANTYGSDYYVRQASLPSGANKKKQLNDEDEDLKESTSPVEIYKAIPTIVDDSDDEIRPELLQQKPFNDDLHLLNDITSDSDLSLVNCYDVENSKIFQQSSNGNQKEIQISVNTEGLLHEFKIDEEQESFKTEISVKVCEGLVFIEEPIDESRDLESKDSEEKVDNCMDENDSSQIIKEEAPPSNGLIEIKRDENFNVAKPQLKLEIIQNKKTETPPNTPTMVINKKSDNTLIRKIYADPVVRSFALSNRIQIPVDLSPIKTPTTPKNEDFILKTPTTPKTPRIEEFLVRSPQIEDVDEIKLKTLTKSQTAILYGSNCNLENGDTFSLDLSDEEKPPTPLKSPQLTKNPEITSLKEQKLVANRLGEFSKSFPNLTKTGSLQNLDKISSLTKNSDGTHEFVPRNSIKENCISVRDLRKMFESNDNSHKPVHSLTARSLSKPLREKLKSQDSLECAVSLSPKILNKEDGENFEFHAEDKIKFYENLK